MKEQYIIYQTFGLGMYNNLIYSYILHWGEKGTYSSNSYIADRTEMSKSSVKRALRFLHEKGYIIIKNEGTSQRHIVAHTEPPTGSHRATTGSERATYGLTESLYNKENIKEDIKEENTEYSIAMAEEAINDWLGERGL